MNDSELPEHVRRFIHSDVPNIDALEVLLFLARRPGEVVTLRAALDAIHHSRVTETLARDYVTLLHAHGVLEAAGEAGYVYRPDSAENARAIDGLLAAYNERPVTLIRTIYALAETGNALRLAEAHRPRKSS